MAEYVGGRFCPKRSGCSRINFAAEADSVGASPMEGIGYHTTLGKRKRREVDEAIAEIARQVEHWFVCGTI